MSDRDIYQILESLDAAQRSVRQLPALFRPANTSPQLSGSYPGKNATRGYMVGEDDAMEGEVVPITRAGYNVLRTKEDYIEKRDTLFRLLSQPGLDPETRAAAKQRLADLDLAARNAGIIKEEMSLDDMTSMGRAVAYRIANQRPEWFIKYGRDTVMQAIQDVTGSEDDWEEIGSSDVSAYVGYVGDYLRDHMGSREEMADREPFAEETDTGEYDARKTTPTSDDDKEAVFARHRERVKNIDQDREQGVAEGHADQQRKIFKKNGQPVGEVGIDRESSPGAGQWYMKCYAYGIDNGGYDSYEEAVAELKYCLKQGVTESLRDGEYHLATVTLDDGTTHKVKIRSDEGFREPIERHFRKQGRKVTDIDVDYSVRSDVYEGRDTATEDVLSTMKKKLGDYLQDVATAIKRDPDLIDQVPGDIDQISAVKTIKTDDGHEIKIHGTEDDGFRISIKNKDLKTAFKNLDEAVLAAEMYCARRRQQALEADYIDEKTS